MEDRKLLIVPDVHGRSFWKKVKDMSQDYKKIIFLGDYLDPYDFDHISSGKAYNNFKEIIEFKKENIDKVILLLGNHDMPYYSEDYYNSLRYVSRHMYDLRDAICSLFNENKELFTLCHAEEDILFTHAGVDPLWYRQEVKDLEDDINIITNGINGLLETKEGILKLNRVTEFRGGRDKNGSCIWNDISDVLWFSNITSDINKFKQVFGHTLQVYYNKDYKYVYGQPVEDENIKMLDTANVYILDVDKYEIIKIDRDEDNIS